MPGVVGQPICSRRPSGRRGCGSTDCRGEYRIPKDSPAGRRRLELELEALRGTEESEAYRPLRRGWFLGQESLREELLEAVSTQASSQHYGDELRESAEARAQGLIVRELSRQGWKESDLEVQPKGHRVKVRLAARLRRESTVSVEWIALKLRRGTRGHLTHLLYWQGRRKPKAQSI